MLRKSGVGDNRLVRSEGIGTSGCGGGRIDLGLPEARVGVSWATPGGVVPKKWETVVMALRDAGSFDFGRLRLPSLKMTEFKDRGFET